MDELIARKMWATLEPYHAMIYFAPEADAEWDRLGFPHHGMGYFASRAAAMGAVAPAVVAATFYNFNPAVVERFIPAAWHIASPEEIIDARYRAVDAALRRQIGDATDSADMKETAAVAREAATACPPDGRPLFAAHAALAWPEEPHMALWHAITLLREFRGDGHIGCLIGASLGPVEALVSYAATDRAPSANFYRWSRGWSEKKWAAAEDRLRARGWLDEERSLTSDGESGRESIEAATDRLAMAPWLALGQVASDELRARVRPWSKAIVATGGLGDSIDDG